MTKFMESVETVSSAIPEADPPEDAMGSETAADTAPADPFAALLEVGAALLKQVTAKPGPNGQGGLVQTDPRTGESYLKLPVPKPEVIHQLAAGLAGLLAALTAAPSGDAPKG
jgi:hypothetical protein